MFFWAVSAFAACAMRQTFYLAGPIYVTALSVVLLGERVGWRRWTAVLVGFSRRRHRAASVLVQPHGAGADRAHRAASSTRSLMISTRTLRAANDDRADGDSISSASFVLSVFAAPFTGWVTPTALDLPVVRSCSASRHVLSLFFVIRALKLASGERRGALPVHADRLVGGVRVAGVRRSGRTVCTLVGAAIIIAAGLYIFWREQVTARGVSPTPNRHGLACAPRTAALAGIGVDAGRRAAVLDQRRGRQVAADDLPGRRGAAAAQRRHLDPAAAR